MKAIGFKNFRKFQEFPDIDLGGINILVGPNNSGKSSLIKALIWASININKSLFLVNDNNASYNIFPSNFVFTDNTSTNYRLGNYNICCHKENGSKTSDEIHIKVVFDPFSANKGFVNKGHSIFCFVLKRDKRNHDIALIKQYTIQNDSIGFYLDVDCDTHTIIKTQFSFDNEILDNLSCLGFTPTLLKQQLNFSNPSGGREMNEQKKFIISASNYKPEENKGITPNEELIDWGDYDNALEEQIRLEKSGKGWLSVLIKEIFSRQLGAKDFLNMLFELSVKQLVDTHIHYIEAHNASHKILHLRDDKNDIIVQTIESFTRLNSKQQTECKEFAEHWMNELSVCKNFNVISDDTGDAFTIKINDDSEYLAQKGTGSIQMFILVLRLATEIARGRKVMMLIEEPEQNLHPKLQSLLADMFFEVYEKSEGRIQLVVETHSEYLVRKLQVIAAQNIERGNYTTEEVNENIKVMFFPENGCTYSMEFDDYGYFIRDFATGFFDEAGRSYRELVRMERGIK